MKKGGVLPSKRAHTGSVGSQDVNIPETGLQKFDVGLEFWTRKEGEEGSPVLLVPPSNLDCVGFRRDQRGFGLGFVTRPRDMGAFGFHDRLGLHLVGTSHEWKLPDIKANLNIASSWEVANDSTQEKKEQHTVKHRLDRVVETQAISETRGQQEDPLPRLRWEQQQSVQSQSEFPAFGPNATTGTAFSYRDPASVFTKSSLPSLGSIDTRYPNLNAAPFRSSVTVVTNSSVSTLKSGFSSSTIPSRQTYHSFSSTSTAQHQPNSTSGDITSLAYMASPSSRRMTAMLPSTGPSTSTVPKAELYTYFGQKPRRKQLGNEDYTWWNNGAKPHELRFTAAFQDPLTGEVFCSGRYGDPKLFQTEAVMNTEGKQMEIVWYTTKKLAEHGAAARCIDCLRYREALQQGRSAVQAMTLVGMDEPYTRDHSPGVPSLPPEVAEKLINKMNQTKRAFA